MRLFTTLVGAIVALAVPVLSRAVPDTPDAEVSAKIPSCGFAYSLQNLQGKKLPLRGDLGLHHYNYVRSVVVELACACTFFSNGTGIVGASGYSGNLPGNFSSFQCEPRTPDTRPPQQDASVASPFFLVKAADIEDKSVNIGRDTEESEASINCGYVYSGVGLAGEQFPLVKKKTAVLVKSAIIPWGCTCRFFNAPWADCRNYYTGREYKAGMMQGNLPFQATCIICDTP